MHQLLPTLAALEYPASGETQYRPGSTLVQKSGHVDDEVQNSALDAYCQMVALEMLTRKIIAASIDKDCGGKNSVNEPRRFYVLFADIHAHGHPGVCPGRATKTQNNDCGQRIKTIKTGRGRMGTR